MVEGCLGVGVPSPHACDLLAFFSPSSRFLLFSEARSAQVQAWFFCSLYGKRDPATYQLPIIRACVVK